MNTKDFISDNLAFMELVNLERKQYEAEGIIVHLGISSAMNKQMGEMVTDYIQKCIESIRYHKGHACESELFYREGLEFIEYLKSEFNIAMEDKYPNLNKYMEMQVSKDVINKEQK